jgi:hypothetical protein
MRHAGAEQANGAASVVQPGARHAIASHPQVNDDPIREDIGAAVGWLIAHPWGDHVDAAFAVVVNPHKHPKAFDLGGKRWPEFVEAVKEACTKPALSS